MKWVFSQRMAGSEQGCNGSCVPLNHRPPTIGWIGAMEYSEKEQGFEYENFFSQPAHKNGQ